MPLLAAHTQVLPSLIALAAAEENRHTVYVGISEGAFRIVLSHERGEAGQPNYLPRHGSASPSHHHGLASQLICVAGNSPTQSDHLGAFPTGSPADEPRLAERAPNGAPELHDSPLLCDPPPLEVFNQAVWTEQPSAFSLAQHLTSIRATVLIL